MTPSPKRDVDEQEVAGAVLRRGMVTLVERLLANKHDFLQLTFLLRCTMRRRAFERHNPMAMRALRCS